MPLPDSNLPASSLPWGREVEKQLEAVKDAVYINNINNSARDATSQTSINNLLDLMADQVELRTYAIEYPADKGASATIIGIAPSLPTSIEVNTSPLVIEVNLNKPRNLLINFSSYYNVGTDFPNATDRYDWKIAYELYVDGIMVDYQSTGRSEYYSPNRIDPLLSESGSINMVKLVSVSAGIHTVSVKEYFEANSVGGQTYLNTTGDSLIVTVTQ